MVTALLSQADRERIEAAIADVERRTSLEIVVAVVARSADYWQLRVLLSVCCALGAALGVLEWAPSVPALGALFAQLPVGALAYAASGTSALHRLLIPRRVSADAVQGYAFRLFAERGLHHTRDRTGLLILVSVLERSVTLLGDAAVHERVGGSGWQSHLEHLIAKLREGHAADGIIEVIARVEAALGSDFPVRPDDINELPNAVIERH
jgi:putative membrane protein